MNHKDINAYITFDRTVYFVEIESSHFNTALDELHGLGYDHQQRFIMEIKSETLEDIHLLLRKLA